MAGGSVEGRGREGGSGGSVAVTALRPGFSKAFGCLAIVRRDAAHRRHAVVRTTPARQQTCRQRTPSAPSQTIRASSGSRISSQSKHSFIRVIAAALGTIHIGASGV
jgi:hypothetical protein